MIKMESEKLNVTMDSPMDLAFSWCESIKKRENTDSSSKRKYEEDSGYFTTPCSTQSRSNISSNLNTPDDITHYDGGLEGTPYNKGKHSKVRAIICTGLQPVLSPQQYRKESKDVDSFSEDVLSSSLYAEAMDTTSPQQSPTDSGDSFLLPKTPESMKKIPDQLSPILASNFPNSPIKSKCKKKLSPRKINLKCRDLPSYKKRSFNSENEIVRWRNRSLENLEHVDILFLLGVRSNFKIVLSKIFSYLSNEDILNMTMVSKTWHYVCYEIPQVKERLLNYIATRKAIKENLCRVDKQGTRTPLVILNHSTPLLTMNHSTPLIRQTRTSPPVSPSKFRFHLFQKEAMKLKGEERLIQCPSCTMPSRVTPSRNLGQCTRVNCQLEFCISCRSPYHQPRPCYLVQTPGDTTPQKNRMSRPSSKESKRSLRRLLH